MASCIGPSADTGGGGGSGGASAGENIMTPLILPSAAYARYPASCLHSPKRIAWVIPFSLVPQILPSLLPSDWPSLPTFGRPRVSVNAASYAVWC